jgi:type II secretory pathway component PulJ
MRNALLIILISITILSSLLLVGSSTSVTYPVTQEQTLDTDIAKQILDRIDQINENLLVLPQMQRDIAELKERANVD